jgi:hypothetical protein
MISILVREKKNAVCYGPTCSKVKSAIKVEVKLSAIVRWEGQQKKLKQKRARERMLPLTDQKCKKKKV